MTGSAVHTGPATQCGTSSEHYKHTQTEVVGPARPGAMTQYRPPRARAGRRFLNGTERRRLHPTPCITADHTPALDVTKPHHHRLIISLTRVT